MDLQRFQKAILKGQKTPADLDQLLNNKCALSILERHDFKILNEQTLKEELSFSHLSEEDKKDLDIMANVKAINEVFEKITFFATCDGYFYSLVIGYWQENDTVEISDAPLVVYKSSEAEFSLLYDYNIIESLLADITMEDEDKYEEFKKLFENCNIKLKEIWDLEIKKPSILPEDLHDKLYNEYRKEFGLESIN